MTILFLPSLPAGPSSSSLPCAFDCILIFILCIQDPYLFIYGAFAGDCLLHVFSVFCAFSFWHLCLLTVCGIGLLCVLWALLTDCGRGSSACIMPATPFCMWPLALFWGWFVQFYNAFYHLLSIPVLPTAHTFIAFTLCYFAALEDLLCFSQHFALVGLICCDTVWRLFIAFYGRGAFVCIFAFYYMPHAVSSYYYYWTGSLPRHAFPNLYLSICPQTSSTFQRLYYYTRLVPLLFCDDPQTRYYTCCVCCCHLWRLTFPSVYSIVIWFPIS